MEVMSRNHAQEVRTLLHKNRVLTLEAEGLRGTAKKVQSQLKVSTHCAIYSGVLRPCVYLGIGLPSHSLNSKDIPDSVNCSLWQEGEGLKSISLTCDLYALQASGLAASVNSSKSSQSL